MANAAQYLSIIETRPRIGFDTNVSLLPDIKVRFNIPINHTLVDEDSELNQYVILVKMDQDETVPVTFVEWDLGTRTLTFRPSGSLTPGDVYQITVRKELQASTGRKMTHDRIWVFQVSDAALGRVSLRHPGDSTAHSTPPPLYWDGVYIVSGSVTYDVEVDRDWYFGINPLWATTVTVSGSGGIHSASIGISLDARQAYYWRVRARTDAVTGEWSETRSFWIGTATQPSPDTVQVFEPSDVFELIELLPEDGSTHLTAFPTIRATFTRHVDGSSITSGTFQLFRSTVDQMVGPGVTQITTGISYTVLDGTVDLIPTGPIAVNTRYTVRLTTGILSVSGDILDQETEHYFVGPYRPFYGGLIAVRAMLGGFIQNTTDDEISFHLWRASIYTHEVIKATTTSSIITNLTLDELINYSPPGGTTWGMIRFTELTAAITLLESYYVDLLQEAGRSRELSVFRYEVDVRLLEELRKRIEELKKDRDDVGATFLLTAIGPRVAIKSQYWYPDPCYNSRARDWSYPGRSPMDVGHDPLRRQMGKRGFRREDTF